MTDAYNQQQPPNPDLQSLNVLVGTWKISGGATGQVTYEWMDGGFFLMQHVNLDHDGHKITGLEIIGHEHAFGMEPSEDIKSRFYSSLGETYDYIYELKDNMLMIWGGSRDSGAYYEGVISTDGNTMTGGWVYPGGGGYEANSTRVKK